MATFESSKKVDLAKELAILTAESKKIAVINQRYDIGFRVALLLITVAATVCTVFIANYDKKPPPELSVTSAILAGIATALSAFAFSQFNFSTRHSTWQRKADTLANLRIELLYSDPDSTKFIEKMSRVMKWGDHVLPDDSEPK
jgi:hypothetical protein